MEKEYNHKMHLNLKILITICYISSKTGIYRPSLQNPIIFYRVVGWPFGLEHTTLLSPLGRGVPPGWDEGLIHPTVLLPDSLCGCECD